jgi:hypothetical protein
MLSTLRIRRSSFGQAVLHQFCKKGGFNAGGAVRAIYESGSVANRRVVTEPTVLVLARTLFIDAPFQHGEPFIVLGMKMLFAPEPITRCSAGEGIDISCQRMKTAP